MLRQTTKKRQPNKRSAVTERMGGAVKGQLIMAGVALLLVVVLTFAMTVAWYTNVVQTGGLQFQTEAWGFDLADIQVADPEVIYKISPGAAGFVPLTINNSTGAEKILAVVNVSKSIETDTADLDSAAGENITVTDAAIDNTAPTDMTVDVTEELRKRVFFYVDTPQTYRFGEGEYVQEETVSRVYLGNEGTESYQYIVEAGDILVLTEAYYSDVPLKWERVFDMEGYYFRGTVSEDAVSVEEYLRPIKYDLSQAVFDWEQNGKAGGTGQLTSIGTQTLAEFLKNVFDADGYQGTLECTDSGEITDTAYKVKPDAVSGQNRVYYKVAVDEETGNGIWVYLCNQADMLAAQSFDSEYSTGNESMEVTVKVAVSTVYSAEKNQKTEIGSAEELESALERTAEETSTSNIQLTRDLTLTRPLEIPQGSSVAVDMNHYSIAYMGEETEYALFSVPEGSTLTLTNGDLRGNEKGGGNGGVIKSTAVSCAGGRAVIGAVKVSGFDTALFVDDRMSGDSEAKISGCDFDTDSTAISVYGNGSRTKGLSRIVVQNSTIKSGYIGISGQGTDTTDDQRWGTEIVVANSTIEGTWAGLYQPQRQSATTISKCRITGHTGIAVKGGTVTIYDSTISGTGEQMSAAVSSGGWTDTGDGVYVEATYGWSATVVLRGTGNTVTSAHGYALELYGVSRKGPGKLIAEGGTFESSLENANNWNEIGTFGVVSNEELFNREARLSEGVTSDDTMLIGEAKG